MESDTQSTCLADLIVLYICLFQTRGPYKKQVKL